MNNRIFLSFLFLSLGQFIFAQEICKLRGEVRDSIGLPVFDASISAFNSKNEGVDFAFTDVEGAFTLDLPCNETYEVEIEHYEYESFAEKFTMDRSRSAKFQLNFSTISLDQAIITARQPITVKGDTIEYDADSFRTQADESLEDILKKLPGIEVENGKVFYEGKEIKTIKVGNREVLGGNTKLLTKNLPADAIDRIQLNKKFKANPFANSLSDEEEAMLNIELKEDKKSLIFGNATIGGDADEHIDLQTKLFYFSPKTDGTLIADHNTFGKEVFSREDYFTFLGGISELMEEGSSFSLREESNSIMLGTSQNASDMKASLGALHFGYEPNKKWFTNAFVLFNHQDINFKSTEERITENITFKDQQTNYQHLFSTLGRLRVDFNPGNRSQWKYRASFNYLENKDEQFADTYLNENSLGSRENINKNQNFSWRHNLSYIQRIGSDHNIGFYARHQIMDSQPELNIFSDETPIIIDELNFYNLRQDQRLQTQNLQLYGIYNHLLTNTSNLRVKVGSNFSWQKLNNSIYENDLKITQNNFETKSDFDFTELYVDLTLTKKLGIFKFDLGVGLHNFDQKTELIDNQRELNFTKLLPHFSTEVNINNAQRINLNYNQQYKLPNVTDLSESYDIQNYYSIYRGFLGLKEALYHNVSLSYGYFNSFNFLNFYVGGTYNRSVDNIQSSSDMTNVPQINSVVNNPEDDQTIIVYFGGGKRFTRHYSLDLRANLNYLDYYTNIKRLDFNDPSLSTIIDELTHNTSFIQNYTLTNKFKFRRKVEFDLGLNYNHNDFKSLTDTKFATWRPFGKLAWAISDKFLLQSDYSYRIQYMNDELINENQALNASLRYHIAKNTHLTIVGGNLLGDERIVSSNFDAVTNQTIINTRELLGRYFLVQLRYKF